MSKHRQQICHFKVLQGPMFSGCYTSLLVFACMHRPSSEASHRLKSQAAMKAITMQLRRYPLATLLIQFWPMVVNPALQVSGHDGTGSVLCFESAVSVELQSGSADSALMPTTFLESHVECLCNSVSKIWCAQTFLPFKIAVFDDSQQAF